LNKLQHPAVIIAQVRCFQGQILVGLKNDHAEGLFFLCIISDTEILTLFCPGQVTGFFRRGFLLVFKCIKKPACLDSTFLIQYVLPDAMENTFIRWRLT
jgi:hypothetical protein